VKKHYSKPALQKAAMTLQSVTAIGVTTTAPGGKPPVQG